MPPLRDAPTTAKDQDTPVSLLRTIVALLMFFCLLGAWLAHDLYQSREKLIADRLYRAMQRSQIIAQGFRTEVLAADYVLRDVLGHIQASDLAYPDPDRPHAQRIRTLLKEKAETVPDFVSMVLFNHECVFLATATGNNVGVRSKTELCEARRRHQAPGPLVTYVPGQASASGQSVLVLSRNLTSPDGAFLGGVMSVIELALVQHRFEAIEVADPDMVAMLDSKQVLLARRPVLSDALEQQVALPTVPAQLLFNTWGASFGVQRDIDGRERLFGFSKIEGFPFVVTYGYDKETALADWRTRAMQLGLGYLAMLFLSLLTARSYWVIQRQRNELIVSRSKLQDLATHDPLTGLHNRQFLDQSLNRELARADRYKQPLAIVLLDIDFFKKVNDQHGHAAGDEVLKALANLLRTGTRASDLICRYGGEEFLAMMPNTSAIQAVEKAEAWRKGLEASHIVVGATVIQITLSAGVAVYPEHGTGAKQLIQRADEMLYRSKNTGRNRVSVSGTGLDETGSKPPG